MAGCGRIGFHAIGDDAGDGQTVDATTARCATLAATCGPNAASCCASTLVPGGPFYRSYDFGTDNAYTDMSSPATVSDFRLDVYEVTVGRFRAFVEAGMGTQQSPPSAGAGARTLDGLAAQGGWDPSWNASLVVDTNALRAAISCNTWTGSVGANENKPMTCVTWYEAMAFCIWDGGYLPTEAEWNYAATGGAEQRAYPWSAPASSLTIDCSYANYDGGGSFCVPPNGAPTYVGSDSPMGDGRWGHADLAGNVFEWALDWYQPYASPCSDCANLTPATYRVFRGGGFGFDSSLARASYRVDVVGAPDSRHGDFGMRCARP